MQPLEDTFRLTPPQRKALSKLGLETLENLLYHFPSRYQEAVAIKQIRELSPGDSATIYGTLKSIKTAKTFKNKTPIAQATIDDGTGTLPLTWFHQPYIAKMLSEGGIVQVTGKVGRSGARLSMPNPEIVSLGSITHSANGPLFDTQHHEGGLHPVYPESRGITSRWFYHALQRVFQTGILDELVDPIPKVLLKRYHLPSLKTALVWIHTPKKGADSIAARKRFAFEEVFLIQLAKQQERHAYKSLPSFRIAASLDGVRHFLRRFPFKPTNAQRGAIKTILDDFGREHPMSRLLEGDVGSGKTAVAAATAYAVATTQPGSQDFGNLQTAYMVPTEILAKQHFESFIAYFAHLPIQIGLITSSGCKKFPSKVDDTTATTISRSQLLMWVKNGEIPILVGTHALVQKSVGFQNLAYVIIDEQHRFGTVQRQRLVRKNEKVPHLLSMTATPIPRTLSLTIYGDLDLTLLDEMPEGRKEVITKIVPPQSRTTVYEAVRNELKSGRQAYVICPRIDEPDPEKELALNAISAIEEAKRLKKDVFPEYEIGLLHGKMKSKEKDEEMRAFVNGEKQMLVATSVVEVGVNVPNATVILIEGAERFGLAQLHQLRGRVLRSTYQAYCYILSDSKTAKTLDRLRALQKAKNGFELAEFDLAQRGAGELVGRRQWGVSDVGMEAMKNIKMVEAARDEAQKMVAKDPNLENYLLLKKKVASKKRDLHFE